MKTKLTSIDWLNHTIAFLSALIGIFIAFQLEDYQDNRQEEKNARVTLDAIKTEIEQNMSIYQANIETLSEWLRYYRLTQTWKNGEIRVGKVEFEKMKSQATNRFRNWQLKGTENDTVVVLTVPSGEFFIDVAPETGISTSSWQAGLYSGALNRVHNEQLAKLNHIYEWTTKDIGLNEREFYQGLLSDEFDNIDRMIEFYTMVVHVSEMKLSRIKLYYDQIKWD